MIQQYAHTLHTLYLLRTNISHRYTTALFKSNIYEVSSAQTRPNEEHVTRASSVVPDITGLISVQLGIAYYELKKKGGGEGVPNQSSGALQRRANGAQLRRPAHKVLHMP